VPVAVEPVPEQHHPATALDETRHAAVLNATPSEDGLSGEVLPEELDALGLDGLELGEVSAAGEKTSLLQVCVDDATPRILVPLLAFVQPELRPTFDDGSDDVTATTEGVANPDETITSRLSEKGHILGRPFGRRERISHLAELAPGKVGRHVFLLCGTCATLLFVFGFRHSFKETPVKHSEFNK